MYETGVARVAANLSTHLSNERYNKNIITYSSDEIGYSFDGNVIDLNTTNKTNLLGKILNFIKRISATKKIKKKYEIDVTISFQLSASLINILTQKNDRVIISIRSFLLRDQAGITKYLYRTIIKKVFKKADLIVPVSEGIKQDLISNYGINQNKIKVINNYYDIQKIEALSQAPIPKKYQLLFQSPTVITSGRLVDQKGQWHLIRAFSKVKYIIPNAKLIILGDGELNDFLKSLAKKLDIGQDVYFLGFQDNPFKYISRSDVYAFPSLYEGFPNALSEAMACGVPVISSDCESGPREILSPNLNISNPPIVEITYADYGILVPVCDGEKHTAQTSLTTEEVLLAESIVELLKSKKLLKKYSEQSKIRIQKYHRDKIIKTWEEAIERQD